MIIVHVDDLLLATNNSHQAESHISRLLSAYDVKDVKRTDDDGGVLYSGKRVRTMPDDVKLGDLALRQEFVKPRCEPACMSRVEKCDRELANQRNTSRRVTRDKSVAEETISARGVGSQARRTNCKALEGFA